MLQKRLEPLGLGEAGFDTFAMAPLLFGASKRPGANLTHNSVGLLRCFAYILSRISRNEDRVNRKTQAALIDMGAF